MNKEQQRIKMAEACGWQEIQNGDAWGTPIGIPLTMPKKDNWRNMDGFFELPDYLYDLNAMHGAEVNYIIPNGLWDEYADWLKMTMRDGSRFWGQATAAQRAEAFLRTLNLWEE
jgi:hypothetical protein